MKKGFTLIELIAVLVILSIISMISVSVVLKLVNDSKAATDLVNIESMVKGSEELYFVAKMDDDKTIINIIESGDNIYDYLDITGATPQYADIRISDGKVYMAIYLNDRCYTKTVNSDDITVDSEKTLAECNI